MLSTKYNKQFSSKSKNMASLKVGFATIFGQLRHMGDETKIPKYHKAPLLFSTMPTNSPLEELLQSFILKEGKIMVRRFYLQSDSSIESNEMK